MKILIIGGKHRHKYAIANRMVKYAEEVTGVPHPFTLISEPDESVKSFMVEVPKDVPNGIFVLKSGYITTDVIDPKALQYDLIVRLPTDSKELEYQYSMETAPSAKYHPVTDFAKSCVNIVLERQAKEVKKPTISGQAIFEALRAKYPANIAGSLAFNEASLQEVADVMRKSGIDVEVVCIGMESEPPKVVVGESPLKQALTKARELQDEAKKLQGKGMEFYPDTP